MSTVFYRCFHSVMAPPVCRNTPRLCAALLLPESCRVFQWNRKRAFASAPVKIRYICREPFCTAFHSSGCLNNSLVKIVVSGGSVVIFCFHADRYAVWMKIWVSSACCTGHKTGSFFVIAEMKLLSLPCTKATNRWNPCWSCCAVPRQEPLPREDGRRTWPRFGAALERASRANSEMRQSLQNNIPALREYFTLNAIQGVFRSREIFDDVCRGIGLLFEYPYFLVCCVYTGKSMAFGEVSPVQFSGTDVAGRLPPDMQGRFSFRPRRGVLPTALLCVPAAEGRMGEKAYWRCFAEEPEPQSSGPTSCWSPYGPASRDADTVGHCRLRCSRRQCDYRFIMSNPADNFRSGCRRAHGEKNGAYPYEELTRLEQ